MRPRERTVALGGVSPRPSEQPPLPSHSPATALCREPLGRLTRSTPWPPLQYCRRRPRRLSTPVPAPWAVADETSRGGLCKNTTARGQRHIRCHAFFFVGGRRGGKADERAGLAGRAGRGECYLDVGEFLEELFCPWLSITAALPVLLFSKFVFSAGHLDDDLLAGEVHLRRTLGSTDGGRAEA